MQIQLIQTTLTRRGSGLDPTSPVRIITEYWTHAGVKVCEVDPAATQITPEALEAIRNNLCTCIEGDGWIRAFDAVLEVLGRPTLKQINENNLPQN